MVSMVGTIAEAGRKHVQCLPTSPAQGAVLGSLLADGEFHPAQVPVFGHSSGATSASQQSIH